MFNRLQKLTKKNDEIPLNEISLKEISLTELPNEIMLKIFFYLDKKDIFYLLLTCKQINNLIDENYFWRKEVFALFNSERILAVNDNQYKPVLRDIFSLSTSLFNHLKNNRIGFWGFKNNNELKICNKIFNRHEVCQAILNDNGKNFITLTTRFSAHITEKVLDQQTFSTYINTMLNNGIELYFGDLKFIEKFLPLILQARAIDCFKLCMNLYFTEVNFYYHFVPLNEFIDFLNSNNPTNNCCRFTKLRKEIFSSHNNYFINQFINYSLHYLPIRNIKGFDKLDYFTIEFIDSAFSLNYEQSIVKSMNELESERRGKLIAICEQYLELFSESNRDKIKKIISENKEKPALTIKSKVTAN